MSKNNSSWQETQEVLRDFPDIMKDIQETNEAIKTGEYKTWITLDQLLAEEGLSKSQLLHTKHPKSSK